MPTAKKKLSPRREASDFDDWHRAQFGPRPSTVSLFTLEREASSLRVQIAKADDILQRTSEWDRTKTTSRYAWNARESLRPKR